MWVIIFTIGLTVSTVLLSHSNVPVATLLERTAGIGEVAGSNTGLVIPKTYTNDTNSFLFLALNIKRYNMGMLGTIAVGCACASLALCIVSIALPFWVYYEYSNGLAKTYYGLWTSCVSVASETQCNSITIGARMAEWSKELTCTILCWHPFPVGVGTISGLVKQVPDYFPSVRALEIMGLLLVAGAGVIGTLKLSVMKENQIISLVAGGQAILAGIFMLIGAIVFAVRTTPDLVPNGPTLHAGFALAIVSGLVAFGAAGLFIVNNFIKVSP